MRNLWSDVIILIKLVKLLHNLITCYLTNMKKESQLSFWNEILLEVMVKSENNCFLT